MPLDDQDEALRGWLQSALGIGVKSPLKISEAARLGWVAEWLKPVALDARSPFGERRQEDEEKP